MLKTLKTYEDQDILEIICAHPQTRKALEIAEERHRLDTPGGQKRKCTGEPYIVHPIAVFRNILEFSNDINLLTAALLHDVIEDTTYTENQMTEEFGEDVTFLVQFVTKPEQYAKQDWKKRKTQQNEHTLSGLVYDKRIGWLKAADIEDNIKILDGQEHHLGIQYIQIKKDFIDQLEDIPHPLKGKLDKIFKHYEISLKS